ncbi:efflux RND transporter periplasmic adaptor subunit [Desulfurivibrio sp. C05AmB]|uniref:efflux RND transporter periplasmic adaptor subunit n=1 Tax=Desulfurivibrio sp. C05AmB TaxID=3374371 RepID=UPI00376EEE4E
MLSREKIFKYVLPVVVLLLGFVLLQALLSKRQPPELQETVDLGPLVEVLEVQPAPHQVLVKAGGTVQAQREISLVPRVAGEVVELGPDFIAGGFVKAGELLFRLDPADYELARQRAEAAVVGAEGRLVDAESRAAIARLEWERFRGEDPAAEPPNPLVLHEPQLLEARAGLAAAQADLSAARLNLERTTIRAPFNGRIRERRLEMGQFIPANSNVATLTGSDQAEVVVPLPPAELPWLDLPAPGQERDGSPARVTIVAGGLNYQWPGHLRRTLGEVESQGRMVRAVVAVADPFGLQLTEKPPIELLPGMFVAVELAGPRLEEVFTLPRRLIRENNTVWLLDDRQHLRMQTVGIVREERDLVVIDSGLNPGDRVIVTDLAGAVEGLALRLNGRNNEESAADQGQAEQNNAAEATAAPGRAGEGPR